MNFMANGNEYGAGKKEPNDGIKCKSSSFAAM
jgi:hypothetical protein